MASFEIIGDDDFSLKVSQLDTDLEYIAKKAIYAGAAIVADRMKTNLRNVLSNEATGQLVASMGVAKIKRGDSGWNTKIGFSGYNTEGVANQLIARVIESGKSGQRAKPFVRPAVNQTKNEVQAAMERVITEELAKIFD